MFSPSPSSLRIRYVALAGLTTLAACSGGNGDQTLAIFAASSLTDAFESIEREFEAANEHVDVTVTCAGSQVLRLQIEQAAPADVFASANEKHITALVDAGKVAQSQRFATNDLVIIVPADNPAGIRSMADLPKAERLVLGTPEVPIGAYTAELIDRADTQYGDGFAARVRDRVVSEESNVRLVRAKVEMGEADAAIVYRTDATAAKSSIALVEPGDGLDVAAGYFVGPISHTTHGELARRYVEFLSTPAGRRVLTEHGFSVEEP